MKVLILALLPAVAIAQLAGGITDTTGLDSTSEPVQFAVQESNKFLATGLGDSFRPLQLVEIVKAQTQVVAGVNYFLTLRLAQDYYCDVTVWYRSWLNDEAERLKVTDGPTCTKGHAASARAVGGLPGGVSHRMPLPSDDSDEAALILAALHASICSYNGLRDISNSLTVTDTSGITYTQQVTSGMTYRFYDVPLAESLCPNTGCDDPNSAHLATCHVKNGGMTATCDFVVQSQPWMSTPFTVSENCRQTIS